MSYLTKRQRYEQQRAQLRLERASFESHWRDIADHLFPRRARFTLTENNRGERKNQKIIDATATLACRTLRSGMMSGITSPARPWFRLTTPDPELAEFGAVKTWLHTVSQRMTTIFLRSNLYNALPTIYGDIGGFGTSAMLMEEDFKNVVRFMPFAIGSYCISNNDRLQVDVFQREFRFTVRQLVSTFGELTPSGRADWSKFSSYVKSAWDNSNYEFWVDVCHFIQPNYEYDPKKNRSKDKRYTSCYYEMGTAMSGSNYLNSPDENKFLRESGYGFFPVLAPRWETAGEDVYGTDCPGMIALGDIKQLQLGEKRCAQAIEKMVNPPMVGPSALRTQKASILPGDINYVDSAQGFRPAHEVNFRVAELENKQMQIRQRISRAFYEDLFLMLANDERTQPPTAEEIVERRSEKMIALGPVLEQLNQDLLDPLIDNTFEIMNRQGLLPEPPEELQGIPLKVEYISIMAQAQKTLGITGLERFAGFVANAAQVNPQILDKVDGDQLIDVYADLTSVPPGIVRTDEDVEAMRAQRQQAAQMQQAMESAQMGARAVKDLSQADMQGDNALTQLMQQAQAGSLAEGI